MPSTTSVTPSGSQDIDGLLYDFKWAVNSLSFSFPSSGSFYESNAAPNNETGSFAALNATQQNFARAALAQYAAISNLTFNEITESLGQHAALRFAQSNAPSTAWAYLPSTGPWGGDSWFHQGTYNNPIRGNYAAHTFLHELGHALGLEHGHDTSNSFGALPTSHDSLEYSVMTYRSYVGAPLSGYTYETWGAPQTLMQDDIAAIQYLYGANYNTNSGNTTYTWSSTSGQMFVNGAGQGAPGGNRIFLTVWDGGGNDTYDFSNYSTNLVVDLRPGAWTTASSGQLSNLGGGRLAAGNIANALLYNNNTASLIENAVGGAGNDFIFGNQAGNTLRGGAGNDTFYGNGGSDTAAFTGLRANYSITSLPDGSYQVVDLRSGSPDGTDRLYGITFLQFTDMIYTAIANHAPVVQAQDAVASQVTVPVQALFSVSDADGDAITSYRFWVDPSAGGHFILNGQTQPASLSSFVVAASNLQNLSYSLGSTTDELWVRASDGTAWSAWDTFRLSPPVNNVPVVQAQDAVAGATSVSVQSLFSVSDADGDAITSYRFWVDPSAGGHFILNGQTQPASLSSFVVAASDLQNLSYSLGSTTDELWVRASDGTAWSAWDTFRLSPPVNNVPVVQAQDAVASQMTVPVQALFSVSDADGDAITSYRFWVDPSAGGHFVLNGQTQPASLSSFVVAASDLQNLSYSLGSTTDELWVRASDGTAWSAWDTFRLSPPVNNVPVVQAQDAVAGATSVSVQSLFSVSDADGDAITSYRFWVDPSAGGHFVLNGQTQPALLSSFVVAASDLQNLSYSLGSTTDELWVRASDGTAWSAWDTFRLSPPVDHATVLQAQNPPVMLSDQTNFGLAVLDGFDWAKWKGFTASAGLSAQGEHPDVEELPQWIDSLGNLLDPALVTLEANVAVGQNRDIDDGSLPAITPLNNLPNVHLELAKLTDLAHFGDFCM